MSLFAVIVLFCSISLSLAHKQSSNGCSAEDIIMLQNIINTNLDLLNVNQNANTVSDELIDFYEEHFSEDYSYHAQVENTEIDIGYSSRTEFLFGDDEAGTGGFVADTQALGRVFLFSNTGYAKCQKEGFKTTATYINRGGDAIRGEVQDDASATNIFSIARFVFTAEKLGGFGAWKITSGDIAAIFYQTFTV